MAISNINVSFRSPDFATNADVNYLRGHIGENIEIIITFETVAFFNEVRFYSNFIKNSTVLYPLSGVYTLSDSYFQSLSTNEVQSWRGVAGTLTPNNLKSWREGTVIFTYVGVGGAGHQWQIQLNTKITPLILENQLTVGGVPAVGLVDYLAGSESLKHIFKIECFTNVGDTIPADTTENNDLSTICINGNVGFFNEFLNGNTANHDLQYINRVDQVWTGRIKNNVGNWVVTDKLILKCFRVIEGSFDSDFTLNENHYYNELAALADGVNVSDSLITDLDCTINGTDATILDFTFTLDRRFFENRGRYIIVANCGTPSANESTNKRSVVRLTQFKDINEIDENLLNFGPIGMGLSRVLFTYHESDDVSTGYDNIAGYMEDIIVAHAKIKIPLGTTDRDRIVLNNLKVSIESTEQPTLEQRTFTALDNTNQSYNRGFELLSTDERNTITFVNSLIESINNKGAIYVSSLYTLVRGDGGSFITDGFTVGAALTITNDLSLVTTIAGVTASTITIVDPVDIQYVGQFWDLDFNGTDYYNVVRTTPDINYKEYDLKYPFKLTWDNSPINLRTADLTNLVFKITANITQTFFNGTSVNQDFTYSVDDFTVYDYDENNTIDTTITGNIETFDQSEVTNQNDFLTSDAINLVRARFNQSGLDSLINKISGIIKLDNVDSLSQFFIRDHSSSRNNKDNEFTTALTTVTSPSTDNIDLKAFIQGTLLDDINYKLSARLDIEYSELAFLTDFDPAIHGTFDPSFQTTGSPNPLWTFEDGSTLTTAAISTTGNGLDGTVQLVRYNNDSTYATDISLARLPLFNNDRIYGVLNLSSLPQDGSGSPQWWFDNNPTLTGVILPYRNAAISTMVLRGFDTGLTSLDLTPLNDKLLGQVQFYNCPDLASLTLYTSTITGVFSIFYFYNSPNLGSSALFRFDNFTNFMEVNNSNFRMDDCNLVEAQINQILIDIDLNATNGFTGRSINLGGANAAPSGAGSTAKTSLISKGFTVTTN